MAGRIRSIKPELLDDEACSALSDAAWRLWVSTWLLADDLGNCRAGDKYLASLVWQDSTRATQVHELLCELRNTGRIAVYLNGPERYLHINGWEKHQRIDNAGKPRVPGPAHENSQTWEPIRGELPRVSANLRESPLDLRPPTPTSDPDQRTPALRPARVRGEASPSKPDTTGNEEPTTTARPTSDTTARTTAAAPPSLPLPGLGGGTTQPAAPTRKPVLDFDAVYSRYPRKEGKAKGMATIRARVKTQADFDLFADAVDGYADKVKADGTEVRYMLHWSTFCSGRWEDYVPGAPALAVVESPAVRTAGAAYRPMQLPGADRPAPVAQGGFGYRASTAGGSK